MRSWPAAVALVALCLAVVTLPCKAASVNVRHETSKADFDDGTINNVSTRSPGEIILAPRLETAKGIEAAYVWCLALDAKGNLLAGTGTPGTVYRIMSSDLSVSTLYMSSQEHVTAIAVDSKGIIYAGTSPGGMIFKIPPGEEGEVLADLPETYVWNLVFDKRGNLYAATGDAGKVYKVSPDGKASEFFVSQETHLLYLAMDEEERLYAGTEPSGLVYQIEGEGRAKVLLDADESEVHAMALAGGGRVLVGTAQGGKLPFPGPPAAQPPKEPKERIYIGGVDFPSREPMGASRGAPPGPPSAAPVKNSIYLIEPFGDVRKLAALDQALVYSMALGPENGLYVGTGPRGTLYRLLLDRGEVATVMAVQQAQVLTMLAASDGGLFLGAGNVGAVHRLGPGYASEGEFVSAPIDAGALSDWGKISWAARVPSDTAIALATRTGNSSKPDLTWSQWSADYEAADGSPIASPPARFIQYRAQLRSKDPAATPVLEEVRIAYRGYNLPPEVLKLNVPDDGDEAPSEPKEAPQPGQAPAKGLPHRGTIKLSWVAKDPNGDRMRYAIYYRRGEVAAWKLLEEKLEKPEYTWDSETVPDGPYFIRVVAGDEPDNVRDQGLTGERVSSPFVIDNGRPELTALGYELCGKGRYRISGVARDATSSVTGLEYAVDGKEWNAALPVDGIFESPEERFAFEVSVSADEEHTIRLRARDRWGNTVVEQVVIPPA